MLMKMIDSQPEEIYKHIEDIINFAYIGGDIGAHYKEYFKTFM